VLEIPSKYFFLQGPLKPYETTDKYEAFVKKVQEALLILRGTEVGQAMLSEIEESKNTVSIHQILIHGSTCYIDKSQGDGACYREILSDDALHAALSKVANDSKGSKSAEFTHACRKLKLTPVRVGDVDHPKVEIPKFQSDLLGRGKAAYWITEYLTPGAGASPVVKWNCEETSIWSQSMGAAPPWSTRPPWLALAHELVHAWRWATGRRVFHDSSSSYHEEAMTVGLAPYDRCRYTENRFRELKKEPRRSFYAQADQKKSEKADDKYRKG
jgi:hypothetical protein